VGRLVLLGTFLVLALTACGASSRPASKPPPPTAAAASKQCRNQAAALAKIDRDLAAMGQTKSPDVMSTLTDRFLLHVSTAPLTNLQRNRLIDHAAAAVSIRCPQCFQALEAERPIPAIRAGDLKCSG
jgi:hypothetical protein